MIVEILKEEATKAKKAGLTKRQFLLYEFLKIIFYILGTIFFLKMIYIFYCYLAYID